MAIRVGIIGTGATVGIADSHMQGLLQDPRARLSAVYNRSFERGERFLAKYGSDARNCSSFEQFAENCDAVIICTPNSSHEDFLIRSLNAGKAVLLEKPMNTTPERKSELEAALKKAPAMVGYVYRFSAQAELLKRIAAEELGRIYTFSCRYGGMRLADPRIPLEWRMRRDASGGGALVDFGSHLLDLAHYTCGISLKTAACSAITAIPERPADAAGRTRVENDDAAALTGVGKNGELFSMLVSRVGIEEFEIHISAEGGIARLGFKHPELLRIVKARGGSYTGEQYSIPICGNDRFETWFAAQASAFMDLCEGKPCPGCSIPEALEIENVLSVIMNSDKYQTIV